MTENEPLRQLRASGYCDDLRELSVLPFAVVAKADIALVQRLKADERFKCGILHGLHVDVGEHRVDFRGHRGTFGKGSLQIVMDRKTGAFYCDVDSFSPYEDVVGFIGHAAEVIRNRWRRWWG